MTAHPPHASGEQGASAEPTAEDDLVAAADPASAPEPPTQDAREGDASSPAAAWSAPLVIRRRGRRVSTEPPPGYTGEPPRERTSSNENDERLRGDVPPHWG